MSTDDFAVRAHAAARALFGLAAVATVLAVIMAAMLVDQVAERPAPDSRDYTTAVMGSVTHLLFAAAIFLAGAVTMRVLAALVLRDPDGPPPVPPSPAFTATAHSVSTALFGLTIFAAAVGTVLLVLLFADGPGFKLGPRTRDEIATGLYYGDRYALMAGIFVAGGVLLRLFAGPRYDRSTPPPEEEP